MQPMPPPRNLRGIAAADAAVCVSISTEANLGDGFFDAARFLQMNGRLCVGSDSQSTVNPAEELRWLEYQQRLRKRRRGVLAAQSESHVGTRLWRDAARERRARARPAGGHASPSAAARIGWCWMPTHPSMAGARARRRPGSAAVRRRGPGDPRRDGRRPVGGERIGATPPTSDCAADFGRIMDNLSAG